MTMTCVRTGTPGDAPAVGRLLTDAFRTDPVTTWLAPDPSQNTPIMNAFFHTLTDDALTSGTVDLLLDDTGALLAAALWFDHSTPNTLPADETSSTHLNEIFNEYADRWRALDQAMTHHHPARPHHYLMAIGVRHNLQGYGLGSRLLDAAHERIGHHATYLEATTPASRRLYQRHGYTRLPNPLHPANGPYLWPMWRPADTPLPTGTRCVTPAQAHHQN